MKRLRCWCFIGASNLLAFSASLAAEAALLQARGPSRPSDTRLWDAELLYREYAKVDPTDGNLLKSLAKAPIGLVVLEVAAALDVVGFRGTASPGLLARVEELADDKSEFNPRVNAITALFRLDPKKGRERGKRAIEDTNYDLSSRISLAIAFANMDELLGYPIFAYAIAQPGTQFERDTEWLLKAFARHDGKTWNDNGEKVSLQPYREALNGRKAQK